MAQSVVDKHAHYASNPATVRFLKTALSTIQSPAFSEVTVFYRDRDFGGFTFHPRYRPNIYREMTMAEGTKEASWHRALFKVFREMHKVRDFRLVLCADVWGYVGRYTMGVLAQAVAEERVAGRLELFHSEPMVVHSPRGSVER